MAVLCCPLLAGAPAAALAAPWAAIFVFLAWFFDRADGQLARRQQTESAWGAWLDANVDELGDVGLHAAIAAAAAAAGASPSAWLLLAAFLGGKYLLMYGLWLESAASAPAADCGSPEARRGKPWTWLAWAYHLPENADFRVHLLILALATGYLRTELAVVAVYYNLRWLVRYGLVARRLRRVARRAEPATAALARRSLPAPTDCLRKDAA
jgi:hypothetical protein